MNRAFPSVRRRLARSAVLLLIAGGLTLCPGRAAIGAAASLEPESRVVVTLQSGRRFLGTVDPKTDADGDTPRRLWMRFERGRAVILRPIAWDRVTRIAMPDGEPIEVARLRQAVEQWKQDDPTWPQRKRIGVSTHRSVAACSHAEPAAIPRPSPPRRSPAAGFSLDAYAANWDGDVEVDGLIVRIEPFNRQGRLTPVAGTLEVNLIGRQDSVVEGPAPFPRVGRWVRRVRPDDFTPSGATYRLPFQAVHPQFDTQIAPYAVVHARLTVPGSGSFDATDSGVRLRPFSPNRDRLELITGERFFPIERTGRSDSELQKNRP